MTSPSQVEEVGEGWLEFITTMKRVMIDDVSGTAARYVIYTDCPRYY